jgi:alpha-beta hydrolase superfamily lysophospholipase
VRGAYTRHEKDQSGLAAIEAVTDDGLTLRGSFAEPPSPRGLLVMFHGIGNERYRGFLHEIARWGFVGVSFDFRAHGVSDGEDCTFGWAERRDVVAIIAAVRARWPGKPIAAWGISLGGAALCYAADVTRDLDAVILESVYRDIDSAFERGRVRTTSDLSRASCQAARRAPSLARRITTSGSSGERRTRRACASSSSPA